MTKKQLTEKWQKERAEAAGEASKLNLKIVTIDRKIGSNGLRWGTLSDLRAQRKNVKRNLELLAARISTIDQFLKDI